MLSVLLFTTFVLVLSPVHAFAPLVEHRRISRNALLHASSSSSSSSQQQSSSSSSTKRVAVPPSQISVGDHDDPMRFGGRGRLSQGGGGIPTFLVQAFNVGGGGSSSARQQTPAANEQATTSFTTTTTTTTTSDAFITGCDDVNRPPSLNTLLRSIQQLCSAGSDIRGRFVDHKRLGSVAAIAQEIAGPGGGQSATAAIPSLTPLASYCFGHALARLLIDERRQQAAATDGSGQQRQQDKDSDVIRIGIGQDPRIHGKRIADSFCRGAAAASSAASTTNNDIRVECYYTGIATTPACASFCLQLDKCDAAVMVTASHLPADRNGLKFFTKSVGGGMTKKHIQLLGGRAMDVLASEIFQNGIIPPSSGQDAVMCTDWVDWMPAYAATLKQAIIDQICSTDSDSSFAIDNPLDGLTIVVNSGNGAGGFIQQVLDDLGADVSGSIHIEPDSDFPNGVPNPESPAMVDATMEACRRVDADLGIMLDTDADRSGFVVPVGSNDSDDKQTTTTYEPLNRNRLIALLGVLFAESHPGCAVVTDSVTSEGLTTFLQDDLGLQHVRYLKGYANVINKAKEITAAGVADAELAIETSGHCAMRENDYLDDGTYTACKVVSLLAKQKQQTGQSNLLSLIAAMEELDEISELRMETKDQSLTTMEQIFDYCALEVERANEKQSGWEIDAENLEGIRVRLVDEQSKAGTGQFFMLRKSLHDPLISLQIEANDRDTAREAIVQPLLELFEREQPQIADALDLSALKDY